MHAEQRSRQHFEFQRFHLLLHLRQQCARLRRSAQSSTTVFCTKFSQNTDSMQHLVWLMRIFNLRLMCEKLISKIAATSTNCVFFLLFIVVVVFCRSVCQSVKCLNYVLLITCFQCSRSLSYLFREITLLIIII